MNKNTMPNTPALRYPMTRLLREYFGRMGRLKYFVPVHLAFMVIICVVQAALPRISGSLIDAMRTDLAGFTSKMLSPALLILLGATVFYYLLEYAQKIIALRFGVNIRAEFQQDLYRHLLRLSEDFYQRTRVGEISTRLTKDMDNGVEPFYMSLCQVVWGGGLIVFSSAMLLSVNVQLFLVFIAMFGIWLPVSWYFEEKSRKISRELGDRYGALTARMTEGIATQELIRAFAREKQREEELEVELDSYLRQKLIFSKFGAIMFTGVQTVLYFFLPMMALYFCVTLLKSHLTVGQVVAVYGQWIVAASPVSAIIHIIPWFAGNRASLDRILAFFDETPLVADADNAPDLIITNGSIQFSDISFTYPLGDRQMVIRALNLTVPPHSRVAVVGPTGSGKSTIVNLVMRLYDPEKGTVCIDGQDLRHYSQQSIRRQIGLVMQDTILWSGTIRENLHFVKPEATDDELMVALEHAELREFVEGTDEKLGTMIGERGVRLSGGQKQRMAIARIFLLNPPIVILDEATSSLDSLTERSIQKTMGSLFEGRTAIIIAHRLSTVIDCDSIVVLENGSITGNGVHQALIGSSPSYRQMCIEQHIS